MGAVRVWMPAVGRLFGGLGDVGTRGVERVGGGYGVDRSVSGLSLRGFAGGSVAHQHGILWVRLAARRAPGVLEHPRVYLACLHPACGGRALGVALPSSASAATLRPLFPDGICLGVCPHCPLPIFLWVPSPLRDVALLWPSHPTH